MDRQEQLKYCKTCTNKVFDRNRGILCCLTNDYPVFQASCADYKQDMELLRKEEIKQKEQELYDKGKASIRNTKIIMSGLILLEIVLIYFFNDWHNTGAIISRIISYIIFGFVLLSAYYRLQFFDYRFRGAIKLWGYETTRKLVVILFSIAILAILCIRNF